MSKRNFILLIIILAVVIVAVFGFLYWQAKTTPAGDQSGSTNFISRFNPFASSSKPGNPAATNPGTDIPNNEPGAPGETAIVKLKKVSSMPVAGFAVFMKERLKEVPVVAPDPTVPAKKTTGKPAAPATEFMPALRYVERTTGNIYQTFADKIEERKFSATVIPKIYEAYFGSGAQTVIMRHLKTDAKTIETFVGTLPKEKIGGDTDSNEIKGTFLADNITDMSLSPDTSKLFYLLNAGNGTTGTVLNLTDSKKTQVFSSAFTEWLSGWPSGKLVTLTTKPAAGVSGYIYTIDTDKKNLVEVLGGINALTALMSPDGKNILYADSSLSLYIYNLSTKLSEQLGVKTLPEKCVWNKTSEFIYCAVPESVTGGAYPDDWYRGEVSFSDQLWKINAGNGNASIIADSTALGEDIDGIKPALDRDENYLFFVNKKDSFLWELNLH